MKKSYRYLSYLTILVIGGLIIFDTYRHKTYIFGLIHEKIAVLKYTPPQATHPGDKPIFNVFAREPLTGKHFVTHILERAFPEYKLAYHNQTKNIPVHLIYIDTGVKKQTIRQQLANQAPYFSVSGEPYNLRKRSYLATGRPFFQFVTNTEHNPNDRSYAYVPFLAWNRDANEIRALLNAKTTTKQRSLSVCYIQGNCFPDRDHFYQLAKKNLAHTAAAGKCQNDTPKVEGYYKETKEFYTNCQFVIAMEKTRKKGYITEKIHNGFISGAIPIYSGDSKIAKEYFNADAFIDLDAFKSMDEAIQHIKYLSENPEKMKKIQETPIFKDGKIPEILLINEQKLSPEAEKIINAYAKQFREEYDKYIKERT